MSDKGYLRPTFDALPMSPDLPEAFRKRVESTIDSFTTQVKAILTRTPFKAGHGIQVRDIMADFPGYTQADLEPFFYILQEEPRRVFNIVTGPKTATPMATIPHKQYKMPSVERVALYSGESAPGLYPKEEVEKRLRYMSRPVLRSSATYGKRYRGSKGSLEPTPISGRWSRALLVPPEPVGTVLSRATQQANIVADRWDSRRYEIEKRVGRAFAPEEIMNYPRRVAERAPTKFGGMLRQPSDAVRRIAHRLGYELKIA
jgi:hypothetical protein